MTFAVPKTGAELEIAILAAIKRGDRSAARAIADAYYERVYRTVPADWAALFSAMTAVWETNHLPEDLP